MLGKTILDRFPNSLMAVSRPLAKENNFLTFFPIEACSDLKQSISHVKNMLLFCLDRCGSVG